MAPILSKLFAVSALVTSVYCWPRRQVLPTLPLSDLTGDSAGVLPVPTTAPIVIALGLGTQNYTCNGTTGKYDSAGALARLFDATHYLSKYPSQVETLPQMYLEKCNQDDCKLDPSSNNDWQTFACPDKVNHEFNRSQLPILGEHFFANGTNPRFDLYNADLYLSAQKAKSVPAPVDTAVPWLYLIDANDGASEGLQSVYRVVTAGGVQPASCDTPGAKIEVPYAAEYWFYDAEF